MFKGEVSFQTYKEIEKRIFEFENYTVIGQDESGKYDMYRIELGDSEKPTIMIMSGLHGTEWHGPQYSLSFMEMLDKNTFPDKRFRNDLLKNFHLVYIPVANPWGIENTTEYAIVDGRRNVNHVDLNTDFIDFSQQETRNIRKVMQGFKPFAYLDCHLIRTNKNREELIIVGNGHPRTDYLKEEIIQLWGASTGLDVDNWPGGDEAKSWISRSYMGRQTNEYTPYTLSILTEMTRPVNEKDGFKAPLSYEQIYDYGMSSIYFFLQTAIKYYKEYNGAIVDEIETPTGFATITRNVDGITESIEESKKDKTIKTTFERSGEGLIQKIIRKIKDLK